MTSETMPDAKPEEPTHESRVVRLTPKPEPKRPASTPADDTHAATPDQPRIVRLGARTDQLPPLPTVTPPTTEQNQAATKATTDTAVLKVRPDEPAAQDTQASEPVKVVFPQKEEPSPRQDAMPLRPYAKPDPTRETAVLSDNNPMLKRMIRQNTGVGTASLGEGREVILVIRGMVERVMMQEGKTYKLGRFEVSTRKPEEIDLSPYGALDRGVSRVHAQLTMLNDRIFITDLTSTNGTYLAGQRLRPNEAMMLRKGDELLIGRLPVQVLFR
jgi:hypothetical protein